MIAALAEPSGCEAVIRAASDLTWPGAIAVAVIALVAGAVLVMMLMVVNR